MGNKVTVIRGEETHVFENTMGHQIGNGAVQVLLEDGDQRIYNKFDDVIVELDAESKAKFAFDVARAHANAAHQAALAEEAEGEYDDKGSVEDEEEESDDGSEADGSEPVKH